MTDQEKLEAEREAYARAMRAALDVAARAILDARPAILEEAAGVATAFLVGDPKNGPLRNPMAHEIAAAIRALATQDKEPNDV